MTWRVISDGEGEATWNMAADEAIFQAVAANSSPPTLRLYYWAGCAVTVGRFQDIGRTVNVGVCTTHKLPIVRRITGGRGILHGGDLTVSIVATSASLGLRGGSIATVDVYQRTAQLLVAALHKMGIDAVMGGCARVRGQDRIGNCFDIVSQADIVDRLTGRKLVGAALHRSGETLLLQASVPLGAPAQQQSIQMLSHTVFSNAGNENAKIERDAISQTVLDGTRLCEAIVESLSDNYASRIEIGRLSELERAGATRLCAMRYGVPEWNLVGKSVLRCN